MRRGTPAAELFGNYVYKSRMNLGMTMRQLADIIKCYPSTVSQIEKGQRVLQERNLIIWADALEIDRETFRAKWESVQVENPAGPITRNRGTSIDIGNLEAILSELTALERSRVQGYVESIIDQRAE